MGEIVSRTDDCGYQIYIRYTGEMLSSRRDVLLMAGYAASGRSLAQTPGELVVINQTGIRISANAGPAIRVSLPGRAEETAAVIEMPEHAWRKKTKGDEPDWFYRMYTNEARWKGIPTWSRENNARSYRMSLPSGVTLMARATLERDGVAIGYEIVNPDNVGFVETQAPTCIKLYRPFTDVFLERTYVHHPGGLDLLASETPERLAKNAEEWLPCRYIVRCSRAAAVPAKRMERQPDGITRYYKMRAADAAFLATESNPKGWVAATHSLDSPDVWTNPARTCHHADSGAPLPARSSAKLSLKLYLLPGGVEEAWARVAI
jgi:hypothetical protein